MNLRFFIESAFTYHFFRSGISGYNALSKRHPCPNCRFNSETHNRSAPAEVVTTHPGGVLEISAAGRWQLLKDPTVFYIAVG
jgi:hypothetical protein